MATLSIVRDTVHGSVTDFYFYDGDPSLGVGVPARKGQTLIRTDVLSLYVHTGDADTAWELITVAPSADGWYNVKAYGAKGDEVTDDTAAIQRALDACATAGGGVVYFPRGVYFVTNGLVVGSKTHCLGDGWGISIIRGKAGTYVGNVINGTNLLATLGAVAKNHITVEGLTIDHQTNQTDANGIAFLPDLNYTGTVCSDILVKDSEVLSFNTHQYGIWNMGTTRPKVTSCILDGGVVAFGALTGQEGIECFVCTDAYVAGNSVRRYNSAGLAIITAVGNPRVGSDCNGYNYVDNYVEGCRNGVYANTTFDAGAAQDLINIRIAGNIVINSNEVGIFLDQRPGAGGASCIDVAIEHNLVDGAPICIEVFGVVGETNHHGVAVNNNTMRNASTGALGALTVFFMCFVDILDNKVVNSSFTGMWIQQTTDTKVDGNYIDGCQQQAVHVPNCTRPSITNNRFARYALGAAVAGVFANPVTRMVCCNNDFSNAAGAVNVLVAGDLHIIEDNHTLVNGGEPAIQNVGTNPSSGVAAPGVGVVVFAVANTSFTNVVGLSLQLVVTQIVGPANNFFVTRNAAGFILNFAAATAGTEQYAWEIRQ